MYNLFSDSTVENKLNTAEKRQQKTRPKTSTKQLEKDTPHLNIGALIRNEFDRLIRNNLLSDEMLQHLLDEKFSKLTFDVNYPIFKEINADQSPFD
jgi:hypothetical protein